MILLSLPELELAEAVVAGLEVTGRWAGAGDRTDDEAA